MLQSRSGGNLQRNRLREEERNSADFQQSQRKRKLVEQNLLGSNAAGRQIKLRTRKRVEWRFQILAEPAIS
jgi:hypothetical protein